MRLTTDFPDGAGAPHVWRLRVYYEDTDAAGIVYYATYLKFAERARTEWLRRAGLTHPRLRDEHGIAFVVRHCAIDYLAAARLDDELTVESHVVAVGCASLTMEQVIFRQTQVLIRLKIRLAAVGSHGRPVRMPASLRAMLAPTSPAPPRVATLQRK